MPPHLAADQRLPPAAPALGSLLSLHVQNQFLKKKKKKEVIKTTEREFKVEYAHHSSKIRHILKDRYGYSDSVHSPGNSGFGQHLEEMQTLQAAEMHGYGTKTTLSLARAATMKHKSGECDWGPQRLQVP